MKRLVIAVDCDDVLIDTTVKLVEVYNERHGTQVKLSEAFMSNNLDWGAPYDEVFLRFVDIYKSDSFRGVKPSSEAIEASERLAKDHELHLVTARSRHMEPVTKKMLEDYFPGMFATVSHVEERGNKGSVCQSLGAGVLIDDSAKHLATASTYGIGNLIWFGEHPWNTADTLTISGVKRAMNWHEVEAEIERIVNS